MIDSYDKALLEKKFSLIILNSLGEKSVDVVKRRLFEKYGISLYQAVNDDYSKLLDILKENFTEGGAKNIEKQFRAAIINLHGNVVKGKPGDLIVSDSKKVEKIMKYIGDPEMMSILNDVMEKPKLIADVLDSCKIPTTSGYRKINKLSDAGLLVISGYEIGTDGRQIVKYTTSFDAIEVFIQGKKSKIRIKPKKIGKNNYLIVPFV